MAKELIYLRGLLIELGLLEGTNTRNQELFELASSWALGDPNFKIGSYNPTPLQPVLATLNGGQPVTYFKPQCLSLQKDFIPEQKEKPDESTLEIQLTKLKDSLKRAKSDTQLLNALEYDGSTLAVHEKWPDIPLYDFVKVASAIAHCVDKGNGSLRLAAGNISGIQNYLYNIVSKRASKLLKGRSFYLTLLTESLANELTEKFNVSRNHIVYSSGGGFYIMLPDSEGVVDLFEDFKKEAVKRIYEAHNINLFVDFSITDPYGSDVPVNQIWDDLFQRLNDAKLQRLSGNPALLKHILEVHIEKGGDRTRDAITNEEITTNDDKDYLGSDDEKIIVTKFTKGQVEKLGRRLRSAKYWITSSVEKFHRDAFRDPFGKWHLLTENTPENLPNDSIVRRINHPVPDGDFIFYGGNDIPIIDEEVLKSYGDNDQGELRLGDPVPFDFLARGEDLDRLGILRMDVDNLGKIFSTGLGSKPSLVRYAAVSRSLDWYFKGYINTIRENNRGYKERTIVIYSGGDDLFIVGRWLDVFNMAVDIRKGFHKWCNGNLTLSGGMVVVTPKFPIMQGALLAGESEHLAKSWVGDEEAGGAVSPEKDAFTLFDFPLRWDKELEVVQKLRSELLDMLDNDVHPVDESIIKRINIHANARRFQQKHNLPQKWMWTIAYDFSRYAHSVRDKNISCSEKIEKWRNNAFSNNTETQYKCRFHFLTLLQIASRIVELERRTLRKKYISEPKTIGL